VDPGALTHEERPGGVHAVMFAAMGCPCEVLVATQDAALALEVARPAAAQAWRIEHKFSRYRQDNIVHALNGSGGAPVDIDAETARLFDFSARCHELSDGLFDITSGALRQAWKFDGSDRVPSRAQVQALLPRIGFSRLQWQGGVAIIPAGMEVDFGGVAKEYAVDCALEAAEAACLQAAGGVVPALLVNFGGDLRANRPPGEAPWQVGVEDASRGPLPAMVLELTRGALATSGDTHRYLLRDGVRYGHILDPRTGWPVPGAPRSVTVAAGTCIEAGTLCTIAMLQGEGAEAFLEDFDVRCWVLR
jgi:thiamine biosynthesis lipoprotein